MFACYVEVESTWGLQMFISFKSWEKDQRPCSSSKLNGTGPFLVKISKFCQKEEEHEEFTDQMNTKMPPSAEFYRHTLFELPSYKE